MEKKSIKCSHEDHKDIDALKFCHDCKIYMCSQCEEHHSKMFSKHSIIAVGSDINSFYPRFSGMCDKETHQKAELEYLCRTHNELCCGLCICKRNDNNYGTHNNCDVIKIEDSEYLKKNELNANLEKLEDLLEKLNYKIKVLKELIDNTQKTKEELKVIIINTFEELKLELNSKQDKLIKELDEKYNKNILDNLKINDIDSLPLKISEAINSGKIIKEKWDNSNKEKLAEMIQKCINIDNGITSTEEMIKKLSDNISSEFTIRFDPDKEGKNFFLKEINNFGRIIINEQYQFQDCPGTIKENKKYIVSGPYKSIVTKVSENNWQVILADTPLPKNCVCQWRIKILKATKHYHIMVGICPFDFNMNTDVPYSVSGWYFYCNTSGLYSGAPHNYSDLKTSFMKLEEFINISDEIKIVMNTREGKLKFIVGEQDIGYSYENIPLDKPLVPAVILANRDDSVEIIPM